MTEQRTDTGAADPACALAHGDRSDDEPRTVVAVFASPVAGYLLHFARDAGFRTVLVEPRPDEHDHGARSHADAVLAGCDGAELNETADVVVCDHHRPELGETLREVLATRARWVGVMGSPRHAPPYLSALRKLQVPEDDIARVHRPIGLNIGSRTPPEIAIATLAGLIADRRGRDGGFEFERTAASV
ncbi:MAG: xanthine dehydrogenase [Propionibacteriales bacterium]|nr:xanthine dehydrogenase [Propionibacteriales bacterium]